MTTDFLMRSSHDLPPVLHIIVCNRIEENEAEFVASFPEIHALERIRVHLKERHQMEGPWKTPELLNASSDGVYLRRTYRVAAWGPEEHEQEQRRKEQTP